MEYFKSKYTKRNGLPWFDTRSSFEKSRDEYFDKLEDLAQRLDDVEGSTSFISDLTPDDFGSGYQFIDARIKELKRYLIHEAVVVDKDWLLASIQDIYESLMGLKNDVVMYDDAPYDDEEDDDFCDYDEDDDFYDDDTDFDDDYDSDYFDDSEDKDDYEW